jgi:hypothetical protein
MPSHEQAVLAAVALRTALDSYLMAVSEEQAAERGAAPSRVIEDETPADATPAECPHKDRQDLGGFGSKEHWICRTCGFEYIRR